MDITEVTALKYLGKKKEILNSLGGDDGQCRYVACEKCPYYEKYNGSIDCTELPTMDPAREIEITMSYEINNDYINWREVPVDTRILVKNEGDESWTREYFKEFKNNKVTTFGRGLTSFTSSRNEEEDVSWDYAKLYEEDLNEMLLLKKNK